MGERIPTMVHGAPETGSLALFMRSFYQRRGEHLVLVPDARHSENVIHEIFRYVAANDLPRLETAGHPKILHEVGGRSNGPKIRVVIVDEHYQFALGLTARMVWCWGRWDSRAAFELPRIARESLSKSR